MTRDTKECPFCAEEIKIAAIVCKHCGRDLPEFLKEYLSIGTKELQNQYECLINQLKSPVEITSEGIANVKTYLEVIKNRWGILVRLIKKTDRLISQGKPSLFGKKEWEKDISILLSAIEMQYYEVFGDNIGESMLEIPAGCYNVWFYFLKIYLEALEMVENYRRALQGSDSKGIKKVEKNRKTISLLLQNLGDEVNDLENKINK